MPCFRSEKGAASFSRSLRYRWLLERHWPVSAGLGCSPDRIRTLIFCGLNPSSADAQGDDPTLRRLVAFARQWGYGRLVVLNLFALVTPSPAHLLRHHRPKGAANDAVLRHWIHQWSKRAHWDLWIGWGSNGGLRGQDQWFLAHLETVQDRRRRSGGAPVFCLGITRAGHPRHPLYLPGNTQQQPWPAAEQAEIGHPEAMVSAITVRP